MKMFGHPKDDFLLKKAMLNFEVYGQASAIISAGI